MVSWGVHSTDPIYYTTSTVCKDADDLGDHGEELQFQETRTTPILPNPNSYECSVESAVISTKALPSFIAPVDETQSDPNVLTPLVGLQLEWNGSLFPVDELMRPTENPQGSTNQKLTYAMASKGSSLPIRFYRRGVRLSNTYTVDLGNGNSSTFTASNLPSVCGILEVLRQNNPNSCEWAGNYIFNVSAEVLIASFNAALVRAFGLFLPSDLWNSGGSPIVLYPALTPAQGIALLDTSIPFSVPNIVTGTQFLLTNVANWTGPALTSVELSQLNGFYTVAYTANNSGYLRIYYKLTTGVQSWVVDNYKGMGGSSAFNAVVSFQYGEHGSTAPLQPVGVPTTLATGGTITASNGWVYHTFTSNGTFTKLNAASALAIQYLVVAGGGAGGAYGFGGGGGSGGAVLGTTTYNAGVTGSTITVGAGGARSNSAGYGANGADSVLSGIVTATGGGGGGGYNGLQGFLQRNGQDGGCGGGGAAPFVGEIAAPSGGDSTQGYPGANGAQTINPYFFGGGGGGMGSRGVQGAAAQRPDGGAALSFTVGAATFVIGGGGGGGSNTGSGGRGNNGSGSGGGANADGVSATANTGGGGGGAGSTTMGVPLFSGGGGSGIVIIAYQSAPSYDNNVVMPPQISSTLTGTKGRPAGDSDYTNLQIDGGAYLEFNSYKWGGSTPESVPTCRFDFFDSNSWGTSPGTVGATTSSVIWPTKDSCVRANMPFYDSPYTTWPPTRDDFLKSALLLGFTPNTCYTVAENENTTFYPPRPLAPAFTTTLQLAAYRNLYWKPQDEYTETSNPAPNGPYYYGYGFTYFINNTVNETFTRCITDASFDKEFASGQNPLQTLSNYCASGNKTLTALTDLSMSGQMYFQTYYNSNNTNDGELAAISVYNPTTDYGLDPSYRTALGIPVVFGLPALYPDPFAPNVMALWMSNLPSGPSNIQRPSETSDYWIYCGPFLRTTMVPGATYLVGETVLYQNQLFICAASNIWDGSSPVDSGNWTAYNFYLDTPSSGNAASIRVPTPIIGASAPVLSQETLPGDQGNTFSFKTDTLAFGTVDFSDPLSSLRAINRDSWGFLGYSILNWGEGDNGFPVTTGGEYKDSYIPTRLYSEYCFVQCNTAFRNLFNGFGAKCLKYRDPQTGQQSAYWNYLLELDPTQPILPQLNPYNVQLIDNAFNQTLYRMADPTFYYWTFTSSETCRYSTWSPIQSVVLELFNVPIDEHPVSDVALLSTNGLQIPTSGKTRRIIAEFSLEEHPSEKTIRYQPQIQRNVFMMSGTVLKTFGYRAYWRNRLSGDLVPLKLSSGGSASVVFRFTPK
jgi:hypothetical protein